MKNIQVLKPFYRKEEILEQWQQCFEKSWTGMGFKTDEFEEKWKKYSGLKTCHVLNSCTSALFLAFHQLKNKYNWCEEDEVITSGITFLATNHTILHNNLKPIFADIDQYGCLDPISVEKKINSKTKAIVFVALAGQIGQLYKILELAKKHKLRVILDAAHLSGTKNSAYQQIGSEEGIDVSCFSGHSVKPLPTSDLGWICWNCEDAVEQDKISRRLSWFGITKTTYDRTNNEGSYKWYYDCNEIGFKMHSNSISASMGIVGLKYLDQDCAYRKHLSELYISLLEGQIEIVPISSDCVPSRHLFQILVKNRDEIMLALHQLGIYPGVHYINNTSYPMYNYAKGTCPKAEAFSNRTISLPLHMHLTEDDIRYVSEKLIEIIKKV